MDVEYGAARQEEKKTTTEKIDRCSEGGHTDHWCDRGRWRDRVKGKLKKEGKHK